MNTFGRTQSNKERLELKSFFKRTLLVNIIPKIFPLNKVNSILNGIVGSSSSSTCYRFIADKYRSYYNDTVFKYVVVFKKGWKIRYMVINFKKQQLIGKVYYYNGYRCKIINKVA